ncbi:hypothetical protein [Nocardia sp. NPDC004604]|uniref:hypothetical protein n=1 Tax=Nocardia sp. NPDC004604 TaxID=3157013 RepID=UPI0033BE275B
MFALDGREAEVLTQTRSQRTGGLVYRPGVLVTDGAISQHGSEMGRGAVGRELDGDMELVAATEQSSIRIEYSIGNLPDSVRGSLRIGRCDGVIGGEVDSDSRLDPSAVGPVDPTDLIGRLLPPRSNRSGDISRSSKVRCSCLAWSTRLRMFAGAFVWRRNSWIGWMLIRARKGFLSIPSRRSMTGSGGFR